MPHQRHRILAAILALFVWQFASSADANFTTFESGQVRPMAMSPDGKTLFVVNTPDNRLEIFDVRTDGLSLAASVPVGMEPVAVAARGNSEAWVVNHLSDSISIVDTSASPPKVIRTLLVGDEPRDIVFAGPGGNRAFITTAHRGQNSPWCGDSANPLCLFPSNPGQMISPGVGRADVWVFDATNLGNSLGGVALKVITLLGDTPRALTVSSDGSKVYAAVFHSGNRTTALNDGAVCNGGASTGPCAVGPDSAPGGLPAPNVDAASATQPEVGLIVQHDGTKWTDELGRNWNPIVKFNLPDKDVFTIDANTNPPVETGTPFSSVGTVIFNMAVNPNSGKVYVSNTEARNLVRFEGTRAPASTTSSVIGHLQEARITILDGANVLPRHLNKHIDYSQVPAPAGIKDNSLATPMDMVVSSDGSTLYVAAFGSAKVGMFLTANLENNTFTPSELDHIPVSGGGPSGLVLDEAHHRLYVLTRFDNSISILDTVSKTEVRHLPLFNPEPPVVVNGRPLLYDAAFTSSNGEASCASCHIFGDNDSLAWDLGDPTGTIQANPLTFVPGLGPFPDPPTVYSDFHPMKGPMTTQTLRGMKHHGAMHWRGDRNSPATPTDSDAAFKAFNTAFVGLLGRDSQLTADEMQAFTDFILEVKPPPNPVRNLDNSLTAAQSAGLTFYKNNIVDTTTCNGCHVLEPANNFFGTKGQASFEGETQHLKIPGLRNLYTKVGMFGLAQVAFFKAGNNGSQGDQIRGFGFLHDGSTDTLFRFLNANLFDFSNGTTGITQRRNVEQFLFAFDSDLKPIVGQQITIDNANAVTVGPRIDLLIARAAAGDNEVVVKGMVGGKSRGWWRNSFGSFQSDKAGEPMLFDWDLRLLASTPGQPLTYTAVPLGTGQRTGIDRDQDYVLDGDDNCPAVANTNQANGDGDGIGDLCDNCKNHAELAQRDSNGDGYGNRCDADFNNNGIVNSLDLGLFKTMFLSTNADGDINGDGTVNSLDLGLFKQLFLLPPGPSAFAL